MPDPDIWDEERWEAYLREDDRRTDRYMELMYEFLRRHPRPDPRDQHATERWKGELRAFLWSKGWRRHFIVLPFMWQDEDQEHDAIAGRTEEDAALGEYLCEPGSFGREEVPLNSFEHIPVYRQTNDLATFVLDWAHDLADTAKTSTLVQFCSSITQIPANVVRGHSLGYEIETLGGNIACAKRALAAANAALNLLREMKPAPHLQPDTYRVLYERVYEVRNALGIYVQDLRERFNLGID